MTRISEKNIIKKLPTIEDTIFGGHTENFGGIVRYDIEALINLINKVNKENSTGNTVNKQSNSYFPNGW